MLKHTLKNTAVALVAAGAALALLAGCSASGSKDSLARVEDTGVLRVGIEGAYPPFNFFDEKNELQGFDVDITTEIADRLGARVEFVATPWDSIIGGLTADKYDLVISSLTITEERKNKVDFTEPYYHTGTQLFAPKDHSIVDPKQLQGLVIGTTIGTTFEQMATDFGAETRTYKSDLLAFEDLNNGRIDGIITDGPVGLNIIAQRSFTAVPVGAALNDPAAGIAIKKNQEAFRAALNEILAEMQADGSYEAISTAWFGTNIQ